LTPKFLLIIIEEPSYSHSEMLANLHLIKLFIWHTLRHDPVIHQYGALPKLEEECLDAAIEEMRREGFADDGLFPKIKEFFYPLTISEYEIRRKGQISVNEHRAYLKQREQLRTDIERLQVEVNRHNATFWDLENQCAKVKEKLSTARADYIRERTTTASTTNHAQQQQYAQAVQQRDRKWQQTQSVLTAQLTDINKFQRVATKDKHESEKKLDEYQRSLKNIEKELAHPRKHLDKQLVKPSRGLILYGPPGKLSSLNNNSILILYFQVRVNPKSSVN
jgi:SpoVK/Ycf46/Vps4 family AAA+-type ATPase